MNVTFRNFAVLMIGIVLGVVVAMSSSVLADRGKPPTALPLTELHTFTEVLEKIKNDYVEPVEDKALLESAIQGMVTGLDPHSAYLNTEAYKDLQVGTSGQFGGLGIEVGMENGFVKVIAPIDDTPAQRSGIEAGDLIIRLDETAVKGMTLNEAVKLMRGKPGSKILLTIIREGEDQPLKISITRDIIRVKSVKKELLQKGFGYVRITQFQSRTKDNLVSAIRTLKKKSSGKLNGLILDLRNNPGGVLSAAVGVSDVFLEKGLIVYTKGRLSNSKLEYRAKPNDMLEKAPLIVLVNGGSASASEIVAGALQDHKRAIIMGAKSFGKGSVQTIIPMPNDSALKLTTALYFTPSGRSIQAEGITPDIPIEAYKLAKDTEKNQASLKERDLSRHLVNKTKKEENKTSKNEQASKVVKKMLEEDYALHEALNLLKGMHIMQLQSARK